MKFFSKKHVLPDNQIEADHQVKMMGEAKSNVAKKLFHAGFADREMFGEFHREQFINLDILQLLQEGKIDLVHRDNCYRKTEVLDTSDGIVLTIPMIVRYEDFTKAIHAAFPDMQTHLAGEEETEK